MSTRLPKMIVSVAAAELLTLMPPVTYACAASGAEPSVRVPAAHYGMHDQEAGGLLDRLPFQFIRNDGQVDSRVRFYAKGAGHATYFTSEGIVVALSKRKEPRDVEAGKETLFPRSPGAPASSEFLKLIPIGANPGMEIIAESPQEARCNFFLGSNPAKWKTGVPTYGAVVYRDVWKGIDLRFYGRRGTLEYDVIMRPGGDLRNVRIAAEGATNLKTGSDGKLIIDLKAGHIVQQPPQIFQEAHGRRTPVAGKFHVLPSSSRHPGLAYTFDIGLYDQSANLIIDPVLSYSSYLGGSGYDQGEGIGVGPDGSIYVTGRTSSIDFPTAKSFQGTFGGNVDVFVAKLNPTGSALVYSTFLGGANVDSALDLAIDRNGSVYVTGYTESTDFPTSNAIQASNAGLTEAFVAKLSTNGASLVYSTYLGGSSDDYGAGIAVNAIGAASITGGTASSDFPLAAPLQLSLGGVLDVFVTRINSAGSALDFSTYLGGRFPDYSTSIALDASGAPYVTGFTESNNFPTLNPIQPMHRGGHDAFVAKLQPSGAGIVYSTFLGGSGLDRSMSIAVDAAGEAAIAGYTNSTDFLRRNAIQPALGAQYDGFVAKLDASGSALRYSTHLGGSDDDFIDAIAMDRTGAAYVVGATASADFPTRDAMQPTLWGVYDGFVSKLDPAGSQLYSTFLGGSGDDDGVYDVAADRNSAAYLIGVTSSPDFPLANAFQTSLGGGGGDAFIAKITTCAAPSIITSPGSQTIPAGQRATLAVGASGPDLSYQWYQGPSGDTNSPVGTGSGAFTTPALFATTDYWVRVSNSCGSVDSDTTTVTVTGGSGPAITSITSRKGTAGSKATIRGSGFSTTKSDNIVYFGRKKATAKRAKPTSLQVTIPKGLKKGTLNVFVSVNGVRSNAVPFAVK